jgi:hypothetical protein
MGKRSRGEGRWAKRVRTEHEKPAKDIRGSAEVYAVECFDCCKAWHFETLHEAHVLAAAHFCDRPKHETFLSVHRCDEFGVVEVEDVDLWENVGTWGPSVGLEMISKSEVEKKGLTVV